MWLFASKTFFPLVALLCGIYAYRRMNVFYRLLFYQLLLAIAVLALSWLVIMYQDSHQLPLNNQWLFNISLPFEFYLLASASFFYFTHQRIKTLAIASMVLFALVFLSEVLLKGFSNYCSNSDALESILIVMLYCLILFYEFMRSGADWYRSPLIWVSTGIVIYFACSVPYISLFSYMQTNNHPDNTILFRIINGVLANIRYAFLAAGFWLIFHQGKLKTAIPE